MAELTITLFGRHVDEIQRDFYRANYEGLLNRIFRLDPKFPGVGLRTQMSFYGKNRIPITKISIRGEEDLVRKVRDDIVQPYVGDSRDEKNTDNYC